MFVLKPMHLNIISEHHADCLCALISVGPISPPQPPSVSAWNKPLTSFAGAVTSEVSRVILYYIIYSTSGFTSLYVVYTRDRHLVLILMTSISSLRKCFCFYIFRV